MFHPTRMHSIFRRHSSASPVSPTDDREEYLRIQFSIGGLATLHYGFPKSTAAKSLDYSHDSSYQSIAALSICRRFTSCVCDPLIGGFSKHAFGSIVVKLHLREMRTRKSWYTPPSRVHDCILGKHIKEAIYQVM